MVMTGYQNAALNHNIKTDNKFFERVEQFKYLRTTITYQNYIQKEINSRLKSRLSFCAESFVFQFATQKYKDF